MLAFAGQLKLPMWFSQGNHDTAPATFDRTFIILAFTLYFLGLMMVASASIPVGERLYNNPFHFVIRHGIYVLLSLAVAFFALKIEMDKWHKSSWALLLFAILLLVAVLIVGHKVNGSTRWIRLGLINVQVAEPAKLFFFCYLSAYLVRRRDEVMDNFKGFFKPLLVLFILAVLLLLQPDLGTVIVMGCTALGLLFLAGARLWQFAAIVVAVLSAFSLMIINEPYRLARITGFLNPWADEFGIGYQLTQSLMAYGRGEFFGLGLGNSIQKLDYLPEAHTDFVMAVVGEEFGFVGVLALLAVVLVLVVKALYLGRQALEKEKYFEGFFAYSIGIWMSFQTAVNVGASAGIFPTKGLTMPLISYGGSSMIVMTLAIVVLIRIDHELRLQAIQATSKGGRK
ncbi:cell division protein FtsW [Thalassotalea sp. Y01]|uniref:cell division protein FtsW n=1 Tax=Thalassotalea sp. Y01 TaxID=2729613 RepID=UPI00145E7205|nr:cell division protein FtsW [Thalassotalea sp. Y01]NMP15775.1 cell division protein FtsW [Thalassotalea sp. Y01]